MQAEEEGLTLVTTEKDHARMAHDAATAALAERARTLPVTLEFDDVDKTKAMLAAAISRAGARAGAS